MKRVFFYIFFVLVLAVVGAILAFNSGAFNEPIEKKVSEASGATVHLGRMSLLLFPLRLKIERTQVEHGAIMLDWDQVTVELASFSPPFDVRVTVMQPKVTMRGDLPKTEAQAPPAGAGGAGGEKPQPPAINLTVKVERGEVSTKAAQVKMLEMTFQQKVLLLSPASVHLKAMVSTGYVPAPMAVTFDTDTLQFGEESVKAQSMKASVAGLQAAVQGASLLKEGRHRWLAEIKAPDLSQLPEPPAIVPAKNWKGSIQASVEVTKASEKDDWEAQGSVAAENVSADLAIHQAGVTADGLFGLNLKTQFLYAKGAVNVPAIQGSLDLTGSKVLYEEMFTKPPGTPLVIKVDAKGDASTLAINTLEMQVGQIKASVTGKTSPQAPFPSEIKIAMPAVQLNGIEKMLIPLRKSPVQGEAALQAAIRGPLAEPANCHILVESLRLTKFVAQFDYPNTGKFAARGTVVADLSGQGELDKGEMKASKAVGTLNLKNVALVAGPLRKEANQEFAADFSLANAGKNLSIEKLDLRTFFGRFTARGTVIDPLKPSLNLGIAAGPLNMTELRVAVPDLRDKIPAGEARASLSIQGPLQTDKPWNEWPLTISGEIAATLPEYKLAAAPEAPAPATPPPDAAAPVPPSDPLLPPGHLTSKAKLKLALDIGTFTKDKLVVKNLSARGHYAGGHYRGDAGVGEVFGGSVKLKGLDVPLLERRPTIQGSVQWDAIVIEDALAFAKPEYKGMATGKTAGKAEFSTVMPADPTFMKALKARGDLNSIPVTLNSVKLGEMINEQLKKIPMLKVQPVKIEPLRGQMTTKFDLANETMQLDPFTFIEVAGSELRMKGKAVLSNMQADLVGTFFWQQDQVKGCMAEGNSDAKGRLIVPLAIKGDMMKPGFSILTDMLSKIAGRALECEKKKVVEKVKKEGTEALKKELNKAVQGLFGK